MAKVLFPNLFGIVGASCILIGIPFVSSKIDISVKSMVSKRLMVINNRTSAKYEMARTTND